MKPKRKSNSKRIRPTRRGRFILTGKVTVDQACKRINPKYVAPEISSRG